LTRLYFTVPLSFGGGREDRDIYIKNHRNTITCGANGKWLKIRA